MGRQTRSKGRTTPSPEGESVPTSVTPGQDPNAGGVEETKNDDAFVDPTTNDSQNGDASQNSNDEDDDSCVFIRRKDNDKRCCS